MTLEQRVEKLEELYAKYGYCLNTLHSYEFEGSSGLPQVSPGTAGCHRSDLWQPFIA